MAARRKIGINFINGLGWTGGSYYVINLIQALGLLPDGLKPELVVFVGGQKDAEEINKTGYPYLIYHYYKVKKKNTRLSKYKKLAHDIIKKYLKISFFDNRPTSKQVEILFPINNLEEDLAFFFERIPHKLFWIPDLQERYLPEFFDALIIKKRIEFQNKIAAERNSIVFSSQDSATAFSEFYPNGAAKAYVMNFAVTHPPYTHVEGEKLRKSFNLPEIYFFSPNQLWAHKNHITVLKAILDLKEKGINVLVAFSGKEEDHRNPYHIEELKVFIKESGLEQHARFLGFLKREDQLRLMLDARAVVQPSLFEGWSTVIEDAKAMSQFVIASDLEVHKDQLQENAWFFPRKDHIALAHLMNKAMQFPPKCVVVDYEQKRYQFARRFTEIVEEVL